MSPLACLVVSYPAKVQIFQLITTLYLLIYCCTAVVSYPAKVQIFQLITTLLSREIESFRCFLPCKGTNFSANHNVRKRNHLGRNVVSYPAKVQIFQLITTSIDYHFKNFSCFLPCKGTNFSANHNKTLGLKEEAELFLTLQRYKFFS